MQQFNTMLTNISSKQKLIKQKRSIPIMKYVMTQNADRGTRRIGTRSQKTLAKK